MLAAGSSGNDRRNAPLAVQVFLNKSSEINRPSINLNETKALLNLITRKLHFPGYGREQLGETWIGLSFCSSNLRSECQVSTALKS
ncbi:hypothetical protein D3C76_1187110 [compost metagenome]